jgi:glycine/D-amino acid oxidase-like deaminating enzyme
MSTRRELLRNAGLAAFFLGLSKSPAYAAFARRFAPRVPPMPGLPPDVGGLARSRPNVVIADAPDVIDIAGFPFSPGWFGDTWGPQSVPFHHSENDFPGGAAPPPDEDVDIAIIGGGLSGLGLAYLLRDRAPVVFELHDRFGGVSKGEEWRGTRYSMGGAYFITPDEGTWLARLYQDLGLDEVQRLSPGGDDPVEIDGVVHADFWTGAGLSPEARLAFERYARLVQHYTNEYPDIPLVDGRDNDWIVELDGRSLKEDIEAKLGVPVPRLLAAGIQGYCYSSFDAGWETISAAAGWNFLAAEEFGRWVCPGGNAYVTDTLWQRLVSRASKAGHLDRLRPATTVVQVDVGDDGRALVTYRAPTGVLRTLRARRAVMCCSKHVAKHMIKGLSQHDRPKYEAMQQVYTHPYIVANVLLDAPVALDFYDLFLLGEEQFPLTEQQIEADPRPMDMITGHYVNGAGQPSSVLTFYWPLPVSTAVFPLLAETSFDENARRIAPHLQRALTILGLKPAQVRAVRMTRWGHSMPVARVRFLVDGVPEELRRPYRGSVYFVNQDNWALPAFETCLLEAQAAVPLILAGL